jgi:hypothetical protein
MSLGIQRRTAFGRRGLEVAARAGPATPISGTTLPIGQAVRAAGLTILLLIVVGFICWTI